jgi:hypothetical protein
MFFMMIIVIEVKRNSAERIRLQQLSETHGKFRALKASLAVCEGQFQDEGADPLILKART